MKVRLKCLFVAAIFVSLLGGCEFSSNNDSLIISGEFPIVYIKRPQTVIVNPTDSISVTGQSDLFFRDIASPNSEERNLTFILTLGKGEVADPEVSYDGRQVIFSMKCSVASSPTCNGDSSWNIWLYSIDDNSFQRVIPDFQTANLADDIDPAFISNSQIVFSSTRQTSMLAKYGFVFTDDKQRLPASVLHTMDINGTKINQISFNRGNDRNPTMLSSGKIMFSRREFAENRNQMPIYTVNPDGSEMNVLYGAHSSGDAFLHPRELPNGKVISTVLPIEGTWESGAIMTLDIQNYSEASEPAPNVFDKAISGQQSSTVQNIPLQKSLSTLGRFTTPYPLMDGSSQVLVSFSFLQELTGNESILDQRNSIESREAPPRFGIYILDTSDKSLKPLVLAEDNRSMTDPVAIFPRELPASVIPIIPQDPNIFDPNIAEGILNIKSVYDVDHYVRLGEGVLTAEENALRPFPLVAPEDQGADTREFISDISRLKDPMITKADARPARFIRISQAFPIPEEFSAQILGGREFIMRKIVGYAPVEPDGSVKIKVPADVPISISVLDKFGRAYENHSNWIQVRPGETLTCNGCHAPRKNEPINRSPIAGSHLNTQLRTVSGQNLNANVLQDETMAETRTRLDVSALELSENVQYTDVWTDTTQRAADPQINYTYASLGAEVPVDGIINYPAHIQPIWNSSRFVNGKSQSCTTCHNGITDETTNPSSLDLNGFIGAGRMPSYDSLLVGSALFGKNGQPLFEKFGGVQIPRRGQSLVNPGYARGSFLIEKLFNRELFSDTVLSANGLDHSAMLTSDEKRLIVEWIDIGAQYFNDPYDENGEIRSLELDVTLGPFMSFHIELVNACGGCHMATTIGNLVNSSFVGTRFRLVNEAQSDFFFARSMVNNRVDPDKSYLLARPSGALDDFHWKNSDQTVPYLEVDSPLYAAIKSWIQGIEN